MTAMTKFPTTRRGSASWAIIPAFALLLAPATQVLAAKAPSAPAPRVQDNAKLLSAETVGQADSIIADIHANTRGHKDVVVETYTEVPGGGDASKWGLQESQNRKVNGLLVLIVQKPGALRIFVDKTTAERFGVEKGGDRDKMVDVMMASLKKSPPDFNKALLDGLAFAQRELKSDFPEATATSATGTTSSAPASSGLPLWAWIVIGVVGFFILMRILGALFGGGGSPSYGGGGYGGGGGGGGFMSGLMGGLFGAVAGNWLYNNMLGGGSSYGSGSDSSGASGGGSDYNPNAGNMADDGGGGSFGGGSAGGGGDFGGSDSGGGGDFGGGGGGDFGGGGGGDFGGGGGGDFGGGGD